MRVGFFFFCFVSVLGWGWEVAALVLPFPRAARAFHPPAAAPPEESREIYSFSPSLLTWF